MCISGCESAVCILKDKSAHLCDVLFFPVRNTLKVRCHQDCMRAQSCPTLCDPTDCSPPGSSVHEISQARTLKQVAIYSSRGSSWSRNRTCVSCISRWILYHWTTQEAPKERWGLSGKQYAAVLLQQTFTHKHRNTDALRTGFLTCE